MRAFLGPLVNEFVVFVDEDRSVMKAFGFEASAAQSAADGEHRAHRRRRHTPDFPASLSCPISRSSRSSATS
jgi:hypothetical protein